jgi:hypothetical protein
MKAARFSRSVLIVHREGPPPNPPRRVATM